MGKREETEKQILNAAVQIISEKGYNATKTSEIAILADISEAIIFKYYKTKKGLLTAIVNKAIEVLGRELAYKPIQRILTSSADKSLDEVFDMIIEDRIQLILKNHALLKVMLTEVQYHTDLRDLVLDQVVNPIFKDFRVFMKVQRDLGLIDPELDDEIILRMIASGLFSSVLKRVIMNQPFDEVEIKREMLQVKRILMKGIMLNS
ncbi:TetR/AcrR family transcriptional regulator [Fusibacter ferrireducens]|uniref:TetR/AcrR family transcriptional regulator n=1 Tax=Fusibacter ferrireducens TaxID=2785058 RepID=A0ABR9ZTK3_9FIRM|nr:TetR/AcrR family transcriptional regulator [Fusibacter ferrireducens]MBF4693802.1 TetR/AcrR family transcriptional regulator [Fusibacter ferrireducens]